MEHELLFHFFFIFLVLLTLLAPWFYLFFLFQVILLIFYIFLLLFLDILFRLALTFLHMQKQNRNLHILWFWDCPRFVWVTLLFWCLLLEFQILKLSFCWMFSLELWSKWRWVFYLIRFPLRLSFWIFLFLITPCLLVAAFQPCIEWTPIEKKQEKWIGLLKLEFNKGNIGVINHNNLKLRRRYNMSGLHLNEKGTSTFNENTLIIWITFQVTEEKSSGSKFNEDVPMWFLTKYQ